MTHKDVKSTPTGVVESTAGNVAKKGIFESESFQRAVREGLIEIADDGPSGGGCVIVGGIRPRPKK